jgi:hypothetical protein
MAWPSFEYHLLLYVHALLAYAHMLEYSRCMDYMDLYGFVWICMDLYGFVWIVSIRRVTATYIHIPVHYYYAGTRPCATLGPLHRCSVPNHLPGSNPAPRLRHSDDHVLHTTHASYPWLCWWLAAGGIGIGIGSSPASEANSEYLSAVIYTA